MHRKGQARRGPVLESVWFVCSDHYRMLISLLLIGPVVSNSFVPFPPSFTPYIGFLDRQQALRTQDTKPANPNQRQRWCFNNDGFISLKGTSLVLGLTESSNEVSTTKVFFFL